MSVISSPNDSQIESATPATTTSPHAPFTYWRVKELCPDLWEDTVVDLCRSLLEDPGDFQSAADGARQKQLRVQQRKRHDKPRAPLDARYLSPCQQELLAQQAAAMGIPMEEVIAKLNSESIEHNKALDEKNQGEDGAGSNPEPATLSRATYTRRVIQRVRAGNEIEDSGDGSAPKPLHEALPDRTSPLKRRREPTLDS